MTGDDDNNPTEEEMITLARLTIFGNDRKKENGKSKEKDENRQPRPH